MKMYEQSDRTPAAESMEKLLKWLGKPIHPQNRDPLLMYRHQLQQAKLTVRELVPQYRHCLQSLLSKQDTVVACKRLEAANRLQQELDREIHRTYFSEGGIRFFCRLFSQHLEAIEPGQNSVHEMRVFCYNSAVLPILSQMERLETEVSRRQQQIYQILEEPWTQQMYLTAMNIREEDCLLPELSAQLQNVETMLNRFGRKEAGNLDQEMEKLRYMVTKLQEITQHNAEILSQTEQFDTPPQRCASEKQSMLEALQQVFYSPMIQRLASEEGDVAAYLETLNMLNRQICEQILNLFCIPGEITEDCSL